MATLQELEDLRRYTSDPQTLNELNRRILDLREALGREPYIFDRRFLFRLLSMGHSQFAEYIGARGPNTQVNAACASTTQAIGLAEDWIRSGRCRRVIVIGADNVTSDTSAGMGRRRLSCVRRRRHRRSGGGGCLAVRSPQARHADGHGRVRVGDRKRRRPARARHARPGGVAEQ